MKNNNFILIVFVFIGIISIACSVEKITPTNVPFGTHTIVPIIPTSTQITSIVPTGTEEFPKIRKAIVVNVEIGLNIRKLPNENSQIITTIPKDSEIIILPSYNSVDNWIMINWNSYSGWVNSKYIEEIP